MLDDFPERVGTEHRRLAQSEVIYRIRSMIRRGEFQVGEKLGSERAMSRLLGIGRSDLRTALASLESSREIRRNIGRDGGIIVADGRLERNINTVESLPVIARRQGFILSSRVLSAVIEPASSSDVRLLELTQDHRMIYDITRLRLIDKRPLSIEISRLPADMFPMFLVKDLTESFYTMFERDYDVQPAIVDETLEPMLSDDRESELLQVPKHTPLIRIRRIARNREGRPFERAIDVYIASRMRFTMHHSGYVRLSATAGRA